MYFFNCYVRIERHNNSLSAISHTRTLFLGKTPFVTLLRIEHPPSMRNGHPLDAIVIAAVPSDTSITTDRPEVDLSVRQAVEKRLLDVLFIRGLSIRLELGDDVVTVVT